MKLRFSLSIVAIITSLAVHSPAQESEAPPTAYQAMKLAMATLPPENQAKLTEVVGLDGYPAPKTWTITFFDPAARAGMRVVTVENGRIRSQKQPSQGYTGAGEPPVLNVAKLNVDSGAAFAVANQKATEGFFGLHYRLRPGTNGTIPVWDLELLGRNGGVVGVMQVSADNASLLSAKYMSEENGPAESTVASNEEDGFVDRASRTMQKTGKDFKNSLFFVGGELEEFFTGERTIDVDENESAGSR